MGRGLLKAGGGGGRGGWLAHVATTAHMALMALLMADFSSLSGNSMADRSMMPMHGEGIFERHEVIVA